jgi:Gpi18-like mannosyltransferase
MLNIFRPSNGWFWYIGGFLVLSLPTVLQFSQIWNLNCFYYDSYLDCLPETTVSKLQNAFFLAVVFIMLWTGYFLLLQHNTKKLLGNWGWMGVVITLAVVTVPIGTFDPFYYFGAAQGELTQHINPYIQGFIRNNPFATQFNYGELGGIMYFPLWLQVSKLTAGLAHGNIVIAVYLYKILATIFLLLSAAMLVLVSRVLKLSDPAKVALAFLLNPFMIFEFAVNGHMDSFMIFFILSSMYFVLRQDLVIGAGLLALGVLVKITAVLVAPFLFLFYLNRIRHDYRTIGVKIITAGLVGLIIIMAMFWPYWEGLQIFDGLRWQARWINNSVFAFFHTILAISVRIVGQAGWVDHLIPRFLQIGLAIVFLIEIFRVIGMGYRIVIKRIDFANNQIIEGMVWFVYMYLLFFQRSYLPWYASLLLVLAVLLPEKSVIRRSVIILTVTSSVYYIIQAVIGYGNMGSYPAQFFGPLIIFSVPIWYLWKNGYLTNSSKLKSL